MTETKDRIDRRALLQGAAVVALTAPSFAMPANAGDQTPIGRMLAERLALTGILNENIDKSTALESETDAAGFDVPDDYPPYADALRAWHKINDRMQDLETGIMEALPVNEGDRKAQMAIVAHWILVGEPWAYRERLEGFRMERLEG